MRKIRVAVCVLAGISIGSCSRSTPPSATTGGTPDTLANGIPRALAPKLASWVDVWRRAAPGFSLDSLFREDSRAFRLEYLWAGAGRVHQGIRQRALVDVLSPDSTWSLDFDMYLDFGRARDASISFERDVDSAPILADFQRDSIAQLAFCGTPCSYDGAYWVDRSRCALTGVTQSGPQADGPPQPFLEIYDLDARRRTRWLGPTVQGSEFGRYQAAAESTLAHRVRRAWTGSDSSTSSRVANARLVARTP